MFTVRARAFLTLLLSFSLLFSGLYSATAAAAMVSTAQVQAEHQQTYDKQAVYNALQKPEVQAKLQSLGVDTADIEQRVQHLTDYELAQINQHMDELEAGSGVFGLVVLVLIVLVILEIFGVTDILPFIHPMQDGKIRVGE